MGFIAQIESKLQSNRILNKPRSDSMSLIFYETSNGHVSEFCWSYRVHQQYQLKVLKYLLECIITVKVFVIVQYSKEAFDQMLKNCKNASPSPERWNFFIIPRTSRLLILTKISLSFSRHPDLSSSSQFQHDGKYYKEYKGRTTLRSIIFRGRVGHSVASFFFILHFLPVAHFCYTRYRI